MEDNEERELTREERLDIEEQAIQALLQHGVKFSVPLKIEPVNLLNGSYCGISIFPVRLRCGETNGYLKIGMWK